ncbi:ATP-binding protein [Nocardiopsis quinghaiensis]|uniref:ATP-binding protein n=1 Tax=Nocardiopsis quinghaiensis TaxID=464995 RepID=UPI00295895F1|nr:tetratricopeptide repeat protein [Nocardiopsis quinghaiensis]
MPDRDGPGADPARGSEPEPGVRDGRSSWISEVSGRAVQAGQVHGGVHFHGPESASGPVPRQLPADVHGFVNRVGELEVLSSRLRGEESGGRDREVALHLITGTAGVGKTALALHWAHRVRSRFPDGQLHVDLRGYGSGPPVASDQVLDRFLRALGVPADAVPPDTDSRAALYRSLLAERRVLVMLDNAASAAQVRPLLPGASDSVVLVTSRDRLSGLVAGQGAQRLTVRTLSSAQAVDLLTHATSGHRGGDTPHEVTELARLCGRLPLALRIAAERAASRPHMPLHDLIQDLRDESGLWDALATDDEEEAHAVRSVFAWSYRVLHHRAARLFRLLGLHPGADFDATAAALLADVPAREARQTLDMLVGAHLVEQTGSDRFRFHDLLRSYAQAQLRQEEPEREREEALGRLLRWYLHTADAAARAFGSHLRHLDPVDLPDSAARSFRDGAQALHWFEREHANLMACVESAASAGMAGTAWRLASVLRHFHLFHAPMTTWETTGRTGLAAARSEARPGAEAELLESLGMAHLQANRAEEGLDHHERALALRRELDDTFGVAMSLNALGLVHLRAHRLDRARELFEECLRLARGLGERRWEGIALGNLAAVTLRLGDPREAVALCEWAVAIHRETDDRITEFATLACLGMAWRELGERERALGSIRESLEVARDPGNLVQEAYALLQLGHVQAGLGDHDEALASYHHAAALHRRVADRRREAESFEGVGEVYRSLDLREESARFLQQAAAGYRGCGDRWRLAVCLHRQAAVRGSLGEDERAREHRTEALELLEEFDDPAAVALREEVGALVRDPGT